MILVTGSSRLLGAAIAKALAQNGHAVCIHAHKAVNEGKEVVKACQACGVDATLFVGDLTQLDDFIRRYKTSMPLPSGLVNNIGPYCYNTPSSMLQHWRELYPLVLEAPMALIEALNPSSIVNIGVANLSSPWVKSASYGLLKQTLWGYTRALAKEGRHANMVSPNQLPHSLDNPQAFTPLETVAEKVAALFSDEGQAVTGQNIEV